MANAHIAADLGFVLSVEEAFDGHPLAPVAVPGGAGTDEAVRAAAARLAMRIRALPEEQKMRLQNAVFAAKGRCKIDHTPQKKLVDFDRYTPPIERTCRFGDDVLTLLVYAEGT